MITVIKKKIKISPELLSKIEWACTFSKTTPKIINGNLRIIKHTNLAYVEPHKVIINNRLYLFFNEHDYFYIDNLKNKYPIKNLNEEIRNYWKILSPEFPKWLLEYIYTPEMMRLDGIGMSCGTLYTKVYNDKYFYSSLTHSVAVALIIWNFTHNKKQTISGLFHDIATPTFKHCIDFMNGDSEHQESTEERTEQIIRNSKEIMALLNRDNIKVEEVSDYHIYSIADNDTPRLSADRFEYTVRRTLSNKSV